MYKTGLLRRVLESFFLGKDDSYGDTPSFEQLEQRVLFSANPLSETWSPDQGQYADNAVVAMPLTAGETDIKTMGVVADVQAPVITGLSLANNASLKGPIEFSATVRDPDSTMLDWQITITHKDTGQVFVMSGDSVAIKGYYATTITLGQIDPAVIGEGNFLLSFQVTDPGGNTAVKEVNFTMDTTAPVVESITANKDVLQTFESIKFTVNASDNIGITKYAFSLDGKQMTTANTFTHKFTEAGTYVLTAVAYDKAGNVSETHTRVITVAECPDLNAPSMSISIGNGTYIKNNTAITATISDNDSLEVNWTATLINNETGQRHLMGSGDRAVQTKLLGTLRSSEFADGSYTIEVAAVDKGGNSSFLSRTFTFDTTPPEVSIETGSERLVTGTMRLTLGIEDMSPVSGATLTVNGRGVTLNPTTRSGLYEFAEPGEYTLVARVSDAAGNVTNVTRVITITENTDIVPPSVTIHSPTEGVYYNNSVALKVSVGDDQASYLGWTVRVIGPNTNVVRAQGEGPVTEEVLYTLPVGAGYSTANGEYTFEVEAVDAAGNITVERVSVMVDSTAPRVLKNNYSDYQTNGAGERFFKDSFNLSWTLSDQGSPEELVTWTVLCKNKDTGQTVALKTGTGFSADITIDPALFASGLYGFSLHAVDAAGNSVTSGEFAAALDTTPPVLQSVSSRVDMWGFNVLATATDDYDMQWCHYNVVSAPEGWGISPEYTWNIRMYPSDAEANLWEGIGGHHGGQGYPPPIGTYVVRVVAVDKCGNVSEPMYLTLNYPGP